MTTRIRLARFGAKNRPFYRIVVADTKAPRDGKFKEIVGTYNPMLDKKDSNRVELKAERITHWLNCGAQPSERVAIFIKNAGIKNHIQDKLDKKKNSTEKTHKPSKKELKKQAEK